MNFGVEGPYVLERHGKKKLITRESQLKLKEELEQYDSGVANACGCYIFAIRAGKGYTPYYVGQACKRSLLSEAMNSNNVGRYNDVLNERNGNPVLFFVPLMTESGRYRRRPSGKGAKIPALDFLERWLISCSIRKNPDLINNKETKFLRGIYVPGIFNARRGDATGDSTELGKALSL